MSKYLKVMFNTSSKAGKGFEYRIGEEFDANKLEKVTLDVYHALLELKKELV